MTVGSRGAFALEVLSSSSLAPTQSGTFQHMMCSVVWVWWMGREEEEEGDCWIWACVVLRVLSEREREREQIREQMYGVIGISLVA